MRPECQEWTVVKGLGRLRPATKNPRHAALMPTPPSRSMRGRGLKPVERFIPDIWPKPAPRRRRWLTGGRHRGGMHRGKIVAAARMYLFRWAGYDERFNTWLGRDQISQGALQEFRATSRSTKRAVGRARGASSDSAGAAVANASNSGQQREARDERRQRRCSCERLATAIRAGDREAALAMLEVIGKKEVLDAKVAIPSSKEATWDKSRRGCDIVLSNNDTTVTGTDVWGGVLGSQLTTEGKHSFMCFMEKGVAHYVGVAYDDVNWDATYNSRNILLRHSGELMVLSTRQGKFAGYQTGDSIRIEVDMAAKHVTFYINDVRLCQAAGITAPVRPFIYIGDGVVVTISSPKVPILHLAALCNARRGVVSSLLAVGGQELLSIKSSAGQTARELAAAVRHTDVVAEIDRWVAQNYPPEALR